MNPMDMSAAPRHPPVSCASIRDIRDELGVPFSVKVNPRAAVTDAGVASALGVALASA